MLRTLILLFGMLYLSSCAKKSETIVDEGKDTTTSQDVPSPSPAGTSFSGTYEYSEPRADGYLYYQIKWQQTGNDVKGTMTAGNYLAKSEVGGFTTPNVIATCDLKGQIKDQVIEVQIEVIKYEPSEDGAPDLYTIMNFPDLDTDVTATIWMFRMQNGLLTSTSGLLMPDGVTEEVLEWEKIE